MYQLGSKTTILNRPPSCNFLWGYSLSFNISCYRHCPYKKATHLIFDRRHIAFVAPVDGVWKLDVRRRQESGPGPLAGGVGAEASYLSAELGAGQVPEFIHPEAEAVTAETGVEVEILDVLQVLLEHDAPAE